jgi:hypothetical protein
VSFLEPSDSSRAVTGENAVASFVHYAGGEWDKLVSNIVRVFDKDHNRDEELNVRDSSNDIVNLAAMDEYVAQAMVKDAYERIPAYLQIVYPLLDDLTSTFAKLNMDDPTKV